MNRWPKIDGSQFSELVTPAMLASLLSRGPIIVCHSGGSFAKSAGARGMTAVVAMPGETTDECLLRLGIHTDENSFVVNFEFDPLL
jgi:hypothetical protein